MRLTHSMKTVRKVKICQLHVFKEANIILHVGVVVTINQINLLAGLPTTKVISSTLEAEWLCNNYVKCNTQILQKKTCLYNLLEAFPTCWIFLHLQNKKKKNSYKCKLFVVSKIHKLRVRKMRDICIVFNLIYFSCY